MDKTQTIREMTNNNPTILNKNNNMMLLREVSMQEVEEALMTMPLGKAPGLDGFTIAFFKSCWSFIKEEVHALVEDTWVNKTVLRDFNAIFLTPLQGRSKVFGSI